MLFKCNVIISLLFFSSTLVVSILGSENMCLMPSLKNGRVQIRQGGYMAKFICNVGFERVGRIYTFCENGKWDSPFPVCVKPGCTLPQIDHGIRIELRRKAAWLMFFCITGHRMEGPSAIFCNGRNWNDTVPTCVDQTDPPMLSCDFEKPSICGWTQDEGHNFDWTRHNKKTPSAFVFTGPKYDHTLGKGKTGYYMYIESTSRNENDTARLLSPIYSADLEKNGCFSLCYHMFGAFTGGLLVYQKPESITLQAMIDLRADMRKKYIIFEKWGNQDDFWYCSVNNLHHFNDSFQIVIEGIRGKGYTSDIAIDDVAIMQGDSCATLPTPETFTDTDYDTYTTVADAHEESSTITIQRTSPKAVLPDTTITVPVETARSNVPSKPKSSPVVTKPSVATTTITSTKLTTKSANITSSTARKPITLIFKTTPSPPIRFTFNFSSTTKTTPIVRTTTITTTNKVIEHGVSTTVANNNNQGKKQDHVDSTSTLVVSILGSENMCLMPSLKNGRVRIRPHMAKFICNVGFELVGNIYAFCEYGKWDSPFPVCVKPGCTLPQIDHGIRLELRGGAWLMFFCITGHRMEGPSAIFCNGRNWNDTVPTCVDQTDPPMLSCDFEKPSICGWTQDEGHNFDWTRHNKQTPSAFVVTGPKYDHTLGRGKTGYYMYIESTSRNENDTARLLSPIYSADLEKNGCFSLCYHMFGAFTGGLLVYQKPESITLHAMIDLRADMRKKYIIFEKWGNQDDFWYCSVNNLHHFNDSFQIVIEGIRGKGYTSDIAIDDVAIMQGDSCATLPTPEPFTDTDYDTYTTVADAHEESSTITIQRTSPKAVLPDTTITVPVETARSNVPSKPKSSPVVTKPSVATTTITSTKLTTKSANITSSTARKPITLIFKTTPSPPITFTFNFSSTTKTTPIVRTTTITTTNKVIEHGVSTTVANNNNQGKKQDHVDSTSTLVASILGSENMCLRRSLKNGRVRIRKWAHMAKFICNVGFELVGNIYATCKNGKWDSPFPVCVKPGCTLPQIDHGIRLELRGGAWLMFFCITGHRMEGPSAIFCNGRNWNDTVPTCVDQTDPPMLSCDFEKPSICGWTQDEGHNFDWTRHNKQTPSAFVFTGPKYDHTLGRGKTGYYMYIESTSRNENDTARLLSPIYSADLEKNGCFSLCYHMFGAFTGGLLVYQKPESITLHAMIDLRADMRKKYIIFEKWGNQDDFWYCSVNNLHHFNDSFQIVIEGIRGKGYTSDIAIDDVAIMQGDSCATLPTPEPFTDTDYDTYTTVADAHEESSTITIQRTSPKAVLPDTTITVPVETARSNVPSKPKSSPVVTKPSVATTTITSTKLTTKSANITSSTARKPITLIFKTTPSPPITFTFNFSSTTKTTPIVRTTTITTTNKVIEHGVSTTVANNNNQGKKQDHVDSTSTLVASILGSENMCLRRSLKNGRVRIRKWAHMAKFICNVGFELVGNIYATCKNGKWDSPFPVCVKPGCTLPQIDHGIRLELRGGAWLMFFCITGHRMEGPSAIFCNGRNWNDTVPTCVDQTDPPMLSCDFEKPSICGWTQDEGHNFDWTRHNKQTPSAFVFTGPKYDHTLGRGKTGYYMYIESTSRNENDTARLLSPIYSADLEKNGCFSLCYHMFGAFTGGLLVYQKPESITLHAMIDLRADMRKKYIIFEKWGNQDDFWYCSVNNLHHFNDSFQIVIEGIRGKGYTSDIAIDDVAIMQGDSCATLPTPEPFTDTDYDTYTTVADAHEESSTITIQRTSPKAVLPDTTITVPVETARSNVPSKPKSSPVVTKPSVATTTITSTKLTTKSANITSSTARKPITLIFKTTPSPPIRFTFNFSSTTKTTPIVRTTTITTTNKVIEHGVSTTVANNNNQGKKQDHVDSTSTLVVSILGSENMCLMPSLKNGRVRIRPHMAKFICNVGFELVGNIYAFCEYGKWDSPFPVCVKPGCTLPQIDHGIRLELRGGAWLMFFCITGHRMEGPSAIFCNGRNWNDTVPTCVDQTDPPMLSCDFEKPSICGWTQDEGHNFDWTRHNKQTPSAFVVTGPKYDHTLGRGKTGYYMYIESTSRNENDTARLLSPIYSADLEKNGCFSLCYHMFGAFTGGLLVYQKPESITLHAMIDLGADMRKKYIIFEKWGNQDDFWYCSVNNLHHFNDSFQIVIEGIRGKGYTSDIAIDDVAIMQGDSCATLPPPEPFTDTDYDTYTTVADAHEESSTITIQRTSPKAVLPDTTITVPVETARSNVPSKPKSSPVVTKPSVATTTITSTKLTTKSANITSSTARKPITLIFKTTPSPPIRFTFNFSSTTKTTPIVRTTTITTTNKVIEHGVSTTVANNNNQGKKQDHVDSTN